MLTACVVPEIKGDERGRQVPYKAVKGVRNACRGSEGEAGEEGTRAGGPAALEDSLSVYIHSHCLHVCMYTCTSIHVYMYHVYFNVQVGRE